VKEGASGDGSESDPFGSLADAIDELKEKGGKTIFMSKGTYASAVTLPKGAQLIGSDAKDVFLTGILRMEDKSKLSRVTLNTIGLVIAGDADVTIEKIQIKKVIGTGIGAEPGNGTITIRDSVIDGARKGMYIQAGREIRFEDIEVVNVAEEGIDIRQNVSGSIRKSIFKNNGESGIEVVLGSADLLIEANILSGNGASGIAAQFYIESKKTGNVRIQNNTLSKNDWGIDCKAPQGKMESKFYFLNSMTVTGNTFLENKDGEIANRCKVLTDAERAALEAEEEKERLAEEARKNALSLSGAELSERLEAAVTDRKEYDAVRMAAEADRVEAALAAATLTTDRLSRMAAESTRSKVSCLLVGPDFEGEAVLSVSADEMRALLTELETDGQQLEFESNQKSAEDRIALMRLTVDALGKNSQVSCSFSLLGWIWRLFPSGEGAAQSILTEEDRMLSFTSAAPKRVLFLGSFAYYPKLRDTLAVRGDQSLFASLQAELRMYDSVIADLAAPIISDADPVLPVGSTTPMAFPIRFASLLSANNIRLNHFGETALFAASMPDSYTKTAIILEHAAADSFGYPKSAIKSVVVQGEIVSLVTYSESKSHELDALRESVKALPDTSQATIVFISWDRKRGTSISAERKALARGFIEAGADIIIGTGLPIPVESETIGAARAYYSLGSPFIDFGVSLTQGSRRAISVEMAFGKDANPVFTEKVLSFNEEGGLQFIP